MQASGGAERSRGVRLGVGAAIVIALAVAAAVIGAAVWRGASAPVERIPDDRGGEVAEGEPDDAAVVSGEGAELYVHVFGAVRGPGLYVLDDGARVVDAISAAGGLTDDAAAEGVNLARELADGEQVRVPTEDEVESGVAEAAPGAGPPGGGGAGQAPVDLNTADAAALETLPGIGPALSQRIISWREENGGFSSTDDLLAVSGIGEKVLADLADLVTV